MRMCALPGETLSSIFRLLSPVFLLLVVMLTWWALTSLTVAQEHGDCFRFVPSRTPSTSHTLWLLSECLLRDHFLRPILALTATPPSVKELLELIPEELVLGAWAGRGVRECI